MFVFKSVLAIQLVLCFLEVNICMFSHRNLNRFLNIPFFFTLAKKILSCTQPINLFVSPLSLLWNRFYLFVFIGYRIRWRWVCIRGDWVLEVSVWMIGDQVGRTNLFSVCFQVRKYEFSFYIWQGHKIRVKNFCLLPY